MSPINRSVTLINRDFYKKLLNCDFKKTLQNKGYFYFEKGNYNLNIIGVRNLLQGNIQDNTFNDALVLIYKTNLGEQKLIYPITTDPGLSVMRNPSNKKGIAILVPGQYRSSFEIGLHKGKYQCLVQNKPLKVYRDNSKDNKLDFNPNTIEEGFFGIHIHKAGSSSKQVDNWSEGCQVFRIENDFKQFMRIIKQSEQLYGKNFTYTLITSQDLIAK